MATSYVRIRNDLIQSAAYSPHPDCCKTLVEYKLIALICSKIKTTDRKLKPITITASEYLTCAQSKNQSTTRINNIIRQLETKTMPIRTANGTITRIQLISHIDYSVTQKHFVISLSPALKEYLVQLHQQYKDSPSGQKKYYSALDLGQIMKFRKRSTIRLYAFLATVSNRTDWTLSSISSIIDCFGCPYTAWSDIRRRAIDPAIAELRAEVWPDLKYDTIVGPMNDVQGIVISGLSKTAQTPQQTGQINSK